MEQRAFMILFMACLINAAPIIFVGYMVQNLLVCQIINTFVLHFQPPYLQLVHPSPLSSLLVGLFHLFVILHCRCFSLTLLVSSSI